ncbi:hypothetical protein Pse7429DRAFT_2533 [Pseudanabaena biceps PCC 7429]|uniref:Uncharacterized protein n=1 Tax=Pseudanabaena biceps PCC 7429 TaxID=927668 RepID=L8N0E6_9CYAN|nr:hypothetical protein Pse7429DRAFT_2533 [Pseudanabaena biceps PCC 7429]
MAKARTLDFYSDRQASDLFKDVRVLSTRTSLNDLYAK